MTYGEQLLAQAEARAKARTRARSARRRRRTLLLPAWAMTMWALVDTLLSQHRRGAGTFDGIEAILWTFVLVLIPIAVSIRPHRPLAAGAVLAVLAGPLLSPVLFGAGWSLLQSAVLAAIAIVVVLGARTRARSS